MFEQTKCKARLRLEMGGGIPRAPHYLLSPQTTFISASTEIHSNAMDPVRMDYHKILVASMRTNTDRSRFVPQLDT